MSSYSILLAQARHMALEALIDALKQATDPTEIRRLAQAIFKAPEPDEPDNQSTADSASAAQPPDPAPSTDAEDPNDPSTDAFYVDLERRVRLASAHLNIPVAPELAEPHSCPIPSGSHDPPARFEGHKKPEVEEYAAECNPPRNQVIPSAASAPPPPSAFTLSSDRVVTSRFAASKPL